MKRQRNKRREPVDFAAEETFHRREWLAQRIGWVVLAGLLIAACAGYLGNGPLTHRIVATENGVLKIDRFAHRDGPTQWIIQTTSNSAARSDLALQVSSSLLERIKIESITPAPQDQAATANGVLFTFHSLDPQTQIVFHIEPQYVGWAEGELQLNDSPPATIKQFVYP